MYPAFRAPVQEAVALYRDLYGQALVTVYLYGSVHREEAVFGQSDLDMGAFVRALLAPDARERHAAARRERLARWPHAADAIGRPRVLEESLAMIPPGMAWEETVRVTLRCCRAIDSGLAPDPADLARARYPMLAFTLVNDATVLFGAAADELLAGRPAPRPDALFATLFLRTPLETIRLASQGEDHREFPLPAELEARQRKLGRLAVLCGAGALMARGQFRSLRGADVLPALHASEPRWTEFLDATARCYRTMQPSAWPAERYLPALRDFAEWAWREAAGAAD